VLVFGSIRDAEVCYHADNGENDGTDEEKPPPSCELCGNTSKENASEEANRCEGAVKAEDKVLSWPWTILPQVS
jgi:hypothetical protein